MPTENPYAASHAVPDDATKNPLQEITVAKAMLVIVASGAAFAAVGATLGAALGYFAPSYYRGVFSGGQDADFDPLQVGLGLGLTQGMICGLLIGAASVLAVALSRRRRAG